MKNNPAMQNIQARQSVMYPSGQGIPGISANITPGQPNAARTTTIDMNK